MQRYSPEKACMLLVLLFGISVGAWGQRAVDLPRNDDYVEIPNPLPEGSRALTVEAWVNLKGDPYREIYAGQAKLGVDNIETNVWNLWRANSPGEESWCFWVFDSLGMKYIDFYYPRELVRPTWNHFAFVVDEFQSSFYLNGVSLPNRYSYSVLSGSLKGTSKNSTSLRLSFWFAMIALEGLVQLLAQWLSGL
jgi:hypothetical protein